MNETDIRKYAELMKELGLSGLEIKDNDKSVRLEYTVNNVVSPINTPSSNNSQDLTENNKDYISITSPMVGVFYQSPTENSAPYVKVGDKIKKGQTLCIIEAMKLMNEITSEIDGEIIEIMVKNAQTVEYGTELFRVRAQ